MQPLLQRSQEEESGRQEVTVYRIYRDRAMMIASFEGHNQTPQIKRLKDYTLIKFVDSYEN
jgi:hypothetical protein